MGYSQKRTRKRSKGLACFCI